MGKKKQEGYKEFQGWDSVSSVKKSEVLDCLSCNMLYTFFIFSIEVVHRNLSVFVTTQLCQIY